MTLLVPGATAQSFALVDASQVGEARRAALAAADALGFSPTRSAAVGVVVTELAGNLAKHAREGQLLLVPVGGDAPTLEVLAVDRGPGMADAERCLTDGYSTAGTPGTGLGAARRMADEFAIDSHPGVGTVIVARCREGLPRPETGIRVGAFALPVAGERECGDAWMARADDERVVACVVDGLGHGAPAARAAHAALQLFERSPGLAPAALVQRMHDALRSTRGAAVLVVEIDRARRAVRSSGVGNVSGAIIAGGRMKSIVSHSGIVGHQALRMQEFEHAWPDEAVLVLASDGLRSQWRVEEIPGLARLDPSVVAATLWRDHARGRDDATVIVLREGAS